MKHGLKQEIKRGLSVLMAVSMVASSALPVMAEEVVEEAVEVETVSEEVADEAEDVVVDVAEDGEVVEEVVDAVEDGVVEDAADYGTGNPECLHTSLKYIVNWADTTTKIDKVCADSTCNKLVGTVNYPMSNAEMVPSILLATGWKDDFAVIYTASATGVTCTDKGNLTFTMYKRTKGDSGAYTYETVGAPYTIEDTVGSHDFDPTRIAAGKAPTCTTDGTLKVWCNNENAFVELESKDWSSVSGLDLNSTTVKAQYATGHKFDTDSSKFAWSADNKHVYLSTTCVNCGLEANEVDLTEYVSYWTGTTWSPVSGIISTLAEKNCVKPATYKFAVKATKNNLVALLDSKIGNISGSAYEDSVANIKTDVTKTYNISTVVSALKGMNYTTDIPEIGTAQGDIVFVWEGKNNITNAYNSEIDPSVCAYIPKCMTCGKAHLFKSSAKNTAYSNDTNGQTVAVNTNNYNNVWSGNTISFADLSYDVEVVVEKVAEEKATCLDDGSVTYSAKLVINGVTYNSSNYTTKVKTADSVDSVNNGKVTVKLPASDTAHVFGTISNETAKGSADGTKEIGVTGSDSAAIKATCSAEGKGYFQCTRCKAWKQRTIAKLPHTLRTKTLVSNATCSKDTIYSAYCENCNTKITGDVSAATLTDNAISRTRGKDIWGSSQDKACLLKQYEEYVKAVKEVLTDKGSAGHNYKIDEKINPTVWAKDFSSVKVTFTCQNSTHDSAVSSEGDLHKVNDKTTGNHTPANVVLLISETTKVTEVEPGFDTVGKAHYEAVASFTDCQGKEWTETVKSASFEIPATGEQVTATVSISGKTVTYNGNRQYVAATTNSDVKPVVSYYKDAALTQKFSGAPYTAGTYYVKATVEASEKYTAAESEVVKLVIKKADPKVTISWKADKDDATKANITVKQKNIGGQQGKVTYTAKNAKIKVSSKGVVTFTNKAKEGTNYKVVIKVKATTNYNGYTRTIKVNY